MNEIMACMELAAKNVPQDELDVFRSSREGRAPPPPPSAVAVAVAAAAR
jgi:hypothetical protein